MSARQAYPAMQPGDRIGKVRGVTKCEGCGLPWHKRVRRFKLVRLLLEGAWHSAWLCRKCREAVRAL